LGFRIYRDGNKITDRQFCSLEAWNRILKYLNVTVLKSGMQRWAGHVGRIGRQEVDLHAGFWCGTLLEDHNGDGSMNLKKFVVRMEGGWNWLRIVSNGRLWY
jgi:hypothetical protein